MWDFSVTRRDVQPSFGRVPAPGQRVAKSWFTKHYGPVPRFHPGRWEFRVFGATAIPRKHVITFKEFQRLPTSRLSGDIHCVTKWTWPNNNWGGVLVSTLLDIAPPAADVTHVMVWAEYGYSANLRISDVMSGQAIFATHNHGEQLSPEHGFPLRLVVPHLYGYKGPKWVRGIEYMVGDRRGFWEERGYHNLGEVRRERRYSYEEDPGEGPDF
ncbi:molybdopterin-dependent oxidoreductase [Streptomyces microflavus]|uniref:molybdopterin-dependent oxidoreductase n=1 Tax=Streptomyces microflavus TaxID=1919 RepID=UPI00365FF7E6